MCQLVLVLLAVVAGYAGAATIERCCSQKMVGGVNYTLVETNSTGQWGCHRDCIFERVGMEGSKFCFKSGDKEVVCQDDYAGYCMCHEGGFPFPDKCVKEFSECRKGFTPVCFPSSPPNCGGCRCLPVSPVNISCNTSLIENNCTVCLDKCTPDGTNECYECITDNCYGPETLAACGFYGDDAEVVEVRCVFTNFKYGGDPITTANTVATYQGCQSQCKSLDNVCKFWNWEAAGTLCSMFEDASGPVKTNGYYCGPINNDCPASA
eukprot:GFUD01118116.1.p1 GENE.GFUD01118116.1~~GFUD01118116.1.p1  ORF type:complete len:298 (-),score=33.53 GFUD01118116.1:514-1308(-)